MLPMKKIISLRIKGEYWDYLLKYDLLYLWGYDGTLEIYNWNKILYQVIHYEYSNDSNFDIGMHKYINTSKLEKLNFTNKKNVQNIVLNKEQMSRFLIKKSDIKTGELAISINSYANKIIFNTDEGLYLSDLKNINSIKKIHESSFYFTDIGKYGKVSLSAGDEGIFGFQLEEKYKGIYDNLSDRVIKISDFHSNKAEWVGDYIYNTSFKEQDFLFNINKKNKENIYHKFRNSNDSVASVSWTYRNKIYRVLEDNILQEISIKVDRNQKLVKSYKESRFQNWKGKIIDGASAVFGTIVELENALVVLSNEYGPETIPREPIRWKVYEETSRYKNLLCIIYDDELMINAYIN
ncbi:hypothetical protein Q9R23_11720 [Exiguobacterium sp. BRG2]|uniref:hypothetical protein n=1 Tax=Exiguobacterium sp. BRG2 TaxID=2962584 RepID=UPI00288296FE|nr:hypothetical protein [Exiguobacterium sp. BRG2]MDT0173641.1 hypothetical protein [Exiguobacterium sp. BRG2]